MTQPLTTRTGIILVLLAAVGWSTAGLFSRAIPVDAPTMILWRGLFGASGMILLILVLQGPRGLGAFARLGRAGWGYALASGIGMLCFIGALKNTSVAHVSIIYATVPFAAAALAWWALRERPSRAAIIASIVALMGAVIMVGFGSDGQVFGDVLAVCMVIASAAMMVIARANPDMPTLAAGAVSAIWAPLLCLPFASLTGITPGSIALLAAFGFINTTMALALFIIGSRHLPAVKTALISALETPMTPLWVWLVFAEEPSAPTILGGFIVMLAVLTYIHVESRKQPT